jgi:DsbC/DsbD-like thiol-disulfide interchange protein
LPVHLTTSTEAVPGKPNAIRLIIELAIDSPWYVYSASTPRDLGTPMTIKLDLPSGISIGSEWERSRSEIEVAKARVEVHRDKAIWTINLVRDKVQELEKELKIQVKFQACNERLCLPATILNRTIALPNTK